MTCSQVFNRHFSRATDELSNPLCWLFPGITGILMSAAGLPVCLTRPPKLVLHPPPVSKSDIKPVPGLGHCCRKTTKKQARKGEFCEDEELLFSSPICNRIYPNLHFSVPTGKTPEEVVKRYLQKVRNPPEEVSSPRRLLPVQSNKTTNISGCLSHHSA